MRSCSLTLNTLALVLCVAPVSAQQALPGQRNRSPLPAPDCDGNGVPDSLELASGAADCNGNLVPDDCEFGATVLLSESFEAGNPPGWTFSGPWHVTSECARPSECAGPNYAYWGDDGTCTMGLGGSGDMILPDILVPAGAEAAMLTFCSAYQGEGEDPYDAADVFVNGDLLDHVSPVEQLDWETRVVDLSAYLGQTVTIRFAFDTMDPFANDFLGWQVDRVRVLALGLGGPSADCNVNGVLDDCETDCNLNGVPDDCDLLAGASEDCQLNGVPDECEVAIGSAPDCNVNGIPDECDLVISLSAALANLEASSETITSFFPDGFDFSGGEAGFCILDGGLNMFDCGSTLNTNRGTLVPYTNNRFARDTAFGPAARYFTAKYPGLFVMAATDCDISQFYVAGFNGTDQFGATFDGLELSINVAGAPYSLFVKRVYGAPEPSVNQLLIVPGDGTGLTHSFPDSEPRLCFQSLTDLTGTDRIFYVLVSRLADGEGQALRPIDAQEIARAVVSAFPAPVSSDGNGNGVPDECD